MPLGVGTGQILVGVGMTVNATDSRMGETGIDGEIIAQGLQHVEHLGELKILFAAMREPTPVLPSRIFPQRHPDAVRMVDTEETLWCCGRFFAVRRKSFQPRQSQGDTGAAQKSSACECACFESPHIKESISMNVGYLELKMRL